MNWQISQYFFSEYPISLKVTKLLNTVVGPIPLWHIHGGKMYRVKIVNEYDQEIPQSQTADNPVAP